MSQSVNINLFGDIQINPLCLFDERGNLKAIIISITVDKWVNRGRGRI